MHDMPLVMYDEDYRNVLAVVQRLVRDANAKGIFVVDRNGQLIGEAGEMRGIDTTSLASLTAGCIAATGGLAKIVGEEEFPVHFHQGLPIQQVVSARIIGIIKHAKSSLEMPIGFIQPIVVQSKPSKSILNEGLARYIVALTAHFKRLVIQRCGLIALAS